jgi:NTE family protein
VIEQRQFTLVLGGGGMRGLAHAGVVRALEEANFMPRQLVGSSVGALVAAAWCAGVSGDEMTGIAHALERDDLFQIAHRDMAFKRMRSPALFHREPIAHFVRGILGDLTFDDLDRRLVVNTVDINTGTQVLWGLPGLTDIRVADAVLASCALPGFLPPHPIGDRYFVDGAAAANLPVGVAGTDRDDLVLAVDVGGRGRSRSGMERTGFASVYARAIEIGIQRMEDAALREWNGPPLLLLRPRVWHVPLLSFAHNDQLVEAGYRAARDAVADPTRLPPPSATGVHPRRRYHVKVLRERCVGCGACVRGGPPGAFTLDREQKAVPRDTDPVWSPVDGLCVGLCPTSAIVAEPVDERSEEHQRDRSRDGDLTGE